MSFQPRADRILVKPDPILDHVSAAGILLKARQGIHTSQEQVGRTGTVLAVGPGKRDKSGQVQPLIVKPGDRIMFGEFQYQEVDDAIVMQEADIAGIFTE